MIKISKGKYINFAFEDFFTNEAYGLIVHQPEISMPTFYLIIYQKNVSNNDSIFYIEDITHYQNVTPQLIEYIYDYLTEQDNLIDEETPYGLNTYVAKYEDGLLEFKEPDFLSGGYEISKELVEKLLLELVRL